MKIVFLGGGNMANALIGGMVKQGFAARDIDVIELGADARDKLVASYGVNCHASADTAPASPDILVLAVKPQQMKDAVAPLVSKLGKAVVISIAAGLDMTALSRWLGGHRQIVRCMPNTPALIGAGITGLCALPDVSADQRAAADRVLRAVGTTVWIEDEAKIDGVTAISGSGPAYVFLLSKRCNRQRPTLALHMNRGDNWRLKRCRARQRWPPNPPNLHRFCASVSPPKVAPPPQPCRSWPNAASRKGLSPAAWPPPPADGNSARFSGPTDASPYFPDRCGRQLLLRAVPVAFHDAGDARFLCRADR
jgi:pyrroline-5-carboxylate reductase